MGEENLKGQLITYCRKFQLSCTFQEGLPIGPDHDRRFTCYAIVNDEKIGKGEDKTKKAASNIAAKMALMTLQNREHRQDNMEPEVAEPEPVIETTPALPNASIEPSHVNGVTFIAEHTTNYVGKFNEYCQKEGFKIYSFADERRGPDHIPEFFCSAAIGQRRFPEAKGKNKKEAKKNAAFMALKELKKEDPANVLLQQISELDDANVMEAASTSESKSLQTSENANFKLESSECSDSQVTFHSSITGTPVHPSKQKRRIAANFSNQEKVNDKVTVDESFLQLFDNIKRLDSGGFGTVFKARKKLDNRDYAVKRIQLCSKKDALEIEVLATLDHQHIVRYFHSWDGEDLIFDNSYSGDGNAQIKKLKCLFIQMEWCSGGTLENWIRKMEKIDKPKSLNIFQQILDGVEYIHLKKLIHRDLKPPNILFAADMIVKIADFGLVTPMSEELEKQRLLRTAGKGTESYMAPEQEEDAYENEVDIFPLGLIMIELFWKFDTCHAKQKEWEKLRNADLPPKFVKQFPSEESLIKLMLSKDPKKRPSATYIKKFFQSKSVYHSNTL